MSTLLQIEKLHVRFPVRRSLYQFLLRRGLHYIEAVKDVSLRLEQGQTVTLVGESGSGKSTLAMAIAGLHKPSAGRILFEGQDVTQLRGDALQHYRRDIAYMWQNPVGSLSPRMSVGALLQEPFKIHGLSAKDLVAESHRLLGLVGLPAEFNGRYPHQLSGGQARRVGVARALALNPKLIIADEPTAGLDVSVQGEILNLLNRLQDEFGLGMFVITHNLNIVRHFSDRTAIMYLGRFVEQGNTDRLFATASHPYTLALLSANPQVNPAAQVTRIELSGEVPSLLSRPTGCEFHPRCPYASELCFRDFPQEAVTDGDHWLTCHYPVNAHSA